ncbi:unnamed protein product [Moneuplotes crassus]|uniref:Glutathione S-transferase n=1 Tax=Euplotes crassus TaxID=5936 RepID=A0AAD1XTN6_EUPCR|nr:unnamed protein product [Moneuplotes crassus]
MGCTANLKPQDITIYGSSLSPSTRSIRWLLSKLLVQHKFEPVSIPGGILSDKYQSGDRGQDKLEKEDCEAGFLNQLYSQKVNKHGYLPVFDIDGRKIYEALSIISYILPKFDKSELYYQRKDLLKKAQNDPWFALSRHVDRPAVEMTRVDLKNSPIFYLDPLLDSGESLEAIENIKQYLDNLNELWPSHGFLTGKQISIVDVFLYNEILNNVTIMKVDLAEFPKVKGWYERVEQDNKIQNEKTMFQMELDKQNSFQATSLGKNGNDQNGEI